MKLEDATPAQRAELAQRLRKSWDLAMAQMPIEPDDQWVKRWSKAIDALPELGDDLYKVAPEFRQAAELMLGRMDLDAHLTKLTQ